MRAIRQSYQTREPSLFEKITRGTLKLCRIWLENHYLCGTTVISRRAAILSSSGGWVLNNEENAPPPNKGLTMQSEDVEGEIAVVGIRLL
jgi:hypothetical protein